MRTAILFLSIILLSNIISLFYGWYIEWWWFDVVQHFLGGFFVAMLMANYLKDHLLPREKIKTLLIIVGATVFMGVVWEFSEYIANQTLIEPLYKYFGVKGYFIGDLEDTLSDLLMDILGAIGFVLFFLNRKNPKLNSLKSLNSEQV